MKSDNAPIFLVGATGTGKSGVALELARRYARTTGAAILAMDAMQVYRGADIGTSKPTQAERAEVPHGGLDLAEFAPAVGSKGSFDVAQYLKHAAEFLREQREAGRRVIIVGGTGLYFRALTRGLCEAPQGSDALREELNALSVEALRERLKRVDGAMLKGLDGSNPRRLIRAIEVKEETGRSLREWQAETPEPLVRDYSAFWIERSKEELAQRLEARMEAMFAQGWVEEVRGLVERYGMEAVRSFAGIGYREIADSCGGQQVWERGEGAMELHSQAPAEGSKFGAKPLGQLPVTFGHPDNKLSGPPEIKPAQGLHRLPTEEGREAPPLGTAAATTEAVKQAILVATRQYAKRQLTWFGREPNLQRVMFSGTQPLPAVLLSLP